MKDGRMNNHAGERRFSPLVPLSARINGLCEVLLFVLMIAMIVISTAQVVCRLVTQALTWSEELTRFLLVAASLVGAAVAFYRGSHISVTFVIEKLPRRGQTLVFLVMQALGVLFFGVLARYGHVMMEREALQTTPALGISMSVLYAQFPLFSAVVILHLLATVEIYLRGGRR